MTVASVQLYTVRDHLAADLEGTLARISELGLAHVEAFDFVSAPDRLAKALSVSGLTAPTGHAPLLSSELYTPDGAIPTPAPEVVFEAASAVGIRTVIDPYVAPERWLDADGVAEIADRLNEAAAVAATFGLRVGYHNHAQEFVATIDGRTAFEHFVSLLDPGVAVELDLYWALAGRQDVPALVARLSDRLEAVHVKDGVVPAANPWAPGAGSFASTDLDQRAAGTGEVPLLQSLEAATALAYAVIEYDNPPGDVFDDIAASLAFLRQHGIAA